MTLRLMNSMTREVEPLAPLAPPKVTLYTCGPTVWNYAHIGNFRTFVFEDVLRRYLEFSGYDVVHVMNLTDVDDRTINAAGAAGVPLATHTAPFVQAFFEDRDYLHLKPATHYPRATEHIPQMIALVERLLERRVAYRGEDGSVYFAIDRFPTYGRLSRIERRELKAGARVLSDEYAKEDARDFVLWKVAKPEDEVAGAAWDAPFGRGRPGWHLECSAMAQHYLGETIDIHAGGVDLLFPHHEDEIAQSEAATGKAFVRHWVHGEFLLVEGTKMSKRYGNFLTARDLREDGWDPTAIRYLFAGTHYRKQLNFTDDGLKAAATGAERLAEFRQRIAAALAPPGGEERTVPSEGGRWAELSARLLADFGAALDEDLDVPGALAAVMAFVRDANRELDERGGIMEGEGATVLDAFDRVTDVLQVVPAVETVREVPVRDVRRGARFPGGPEEASPPAAGEPLDTWANRMATLRYVYRVQREWAKADAVRELLKVHGFEVRDTKDGVKLVSRHGPVPGQ